MTDTPDSPGYADALHELDTILRELEGSDVDVDRLAERVARLGVDHHLPRQDHHRGSADPPGDRRSRCRRRRRRPALTPDVPRTRHGTVGEDPE